MAIAIVAARQAGDPEPTNIEWVETTRASAAKLLSGSTVASAAEDVDVTLVEMDGTFTSPHGAPPGDQSETPMTSPSGSVLTVVIDASTGDVLDVGYTEHRVDLGALGSVQSDDQGN